MERQLNTDCKTEPDYLKVLDYLLFGLPATLHISSPASVYFSDCPCDCD
jgi:hypothetical protein